MKGWNLEVGPVHKAFLILNMEKFIKSKTDLPLILKIAGILWKVINFRLLKQPEGIEIRQVDRFEAWVDRLLAEISPEYEIIAQRDSKF